MHSNNWVHNSQYSATAVNNFLREIKETSSKSFKMENSPEWIQGVCFNVIQHLKSQNDNTRIKKIDEQLSNLIFNKKLE